MTIINNTITISNDNKKIEFELPDLPKGDDEVRLMVTRVERESSKFGLSCWSSGVTIPPGLTFSR